MTTFTDPTHPHATDTVAAANIPVVTSPTRIEPQSESDDRRVTILGVTITDVTQHWAVEIIEQAIHRDPPKRCTIFFANAHTLNLAAADPSYRRTLATADHVFGDGTGVRWAARLQSVRVKDNLVGTDLMPALFHTTAGRGYRYFLLGSDASTIDRAACYAAEQFPGWTQAGYHQGFLTTEELNSQAIDQINQSRADVLLVGMGNPLQERWIAAHRDRLDVPVCLGIGGLFDYWAENVSRAPAWIRRLGHEWAWRLYQQPRDKARRYLVGNPLFLARVFAERFGS